MCGGFLIGLGLVREHVFFVRGGGIMLLEEAERNDGPGIAIGEDERLPLTLSISEV